MNACLLSGAGGSSNWLPLIVPLAVAALLLFSWDAVRSRLRRGREKPLQTDNSDTQDSEQ